MRMFTWIRNRLDVKIILSTVIAMMSGDHMRVDRRNAQQDTVRAPEPTLDAYAPAGSGSVNASMKNGHHPERAGVKI